MHSQIGPTPSVSGFAGLANQVVVGSIQENLFIAGRSFSFEDYFTFGASEVKTFVFDPTACGCSQLVINPLIFAATGGPIIVDIYANTTADKDGTLLGVSNRRFGSPATMAELRLDPSNITLGTRISGDIVPATGTAPANSTGGANAQGLPFELSKNLKYSITMTNNDGAGVIAVFKFTYFEING